MRTSCTVPSPAEVSLSTAQKANPWKSRLNDRLHGQPYPLFVFAGASGERLTIPAASLWAGARLWINAFREAGLRTGDRFVLALPPSPAFVQVLIAALWEGLTIVPTPPTDAIAPLLHDLDAAGGVTADGDSGTWRPDGCSGPAEGSLPLPRPTRHDPTPDVRFLLRTSGTSGNGTGKWIALGDQNVLSVLDSHLAALGLREEETRLLSILPWHHAFGLVLDLMIGIFAGAEIVRDENSGRDIPALLALACEMETTHFSTVPLLVKGIARSDDGRAFLGRLTGGIVGGATIDVALAEILSHTLLRVGYGQTEAAPGIALGMPGRFPGGGYLGQPLGCATRINTGGILEFAGANTCIGTWKDGLTRIQPGAFISTGDLVREENGDLFFLGRADDSFKMANGRWIEAGTEETRLRAAFPQVQEVFLWTADGESLRLAICLLPGASLPTTADFAAALGSLGKLLNSVDPLPAHCWVRTPKGCISRQQTLTAIRAEVKKEILTSPAHRLILCPEMPLTCADLQKYAEQDEINIELSAQAIENLDNSHRLFQSLRESGTPIYGTTTGFGPHVRYSAGDDSAHGLGLIAHLSAGWGADAPAEIVRGAMLLRLQTLIRGYSGVRLPVVEGYAALLRAGVVPVVPEIGSVGASGDLIPLAQIARVLCGEGDVWYRGERISAKGALESAGLPTVALQGRDALALTNGTSFLTSYAAHASARAEVLLATAETLTGAMYALLGCRTAALDARLHTARGHKGQERSAAAIRAAMSGYADAEDPTRPLQEIYSIRCAPQILGACRENREFARRIIETEMNGVNDNPLILPNDLTNDTESGFCLHGGNFQGQQVAFAADALNAALTQAAVLAERQIDALVSPSRTNDFAPLLLAWEPGRTSGLAGAQITATALLAEMRAHLAHHATFSIPTNAGNQDVVSMGTLAARMVYGQTERFAAILSVLAIALLQLNFLRGKQRATGRVVDWKQGLAAIALQFAPLQEDRPLRDDIAAIAARILSGTLSSSDQL